MLVLLTDFTFGLLAELSSVSDGNSTAAEHRLKFLPPNVYLQTSCGRDQWIRLDFKHLMSVINVTLHVPTFDNKVDFPIECGPKDDGDYYEILCTQRQKFPPNPSSPYWREIGRVNVNNLTQQTNDTVEIEGDGTHCYGIGIFNSNKNSSILLKDVTIYGSE